MIETSVPNASREVIIAGHSHIFAMGAPNSYKGERQLQPVPQFENMFFLMEEWRGNRTPEYWAALAENARDRIIVISFNGNQHNASFLFRSGPAFDFWDADDRGNLLPGADVIPRLMVREFFKPSLAGLDSVVAEAMDGGAAKVIVLGTPPCKGDLDFIRKIVLGSEYFRRAAEKIGCDVETVAITDTSVRVKLWGVLQEMMADIAEKRGATFVPVPSAVLDGTRCLKSEFWANDVTHTNAAYGNLILKHLSLSLNLDENDGSSL
ncbi:hypothetical protein [Xanthobacter sp. VNH20]|uniref:hypothetical protein n=1 Tax=Xanthobacter sp. VNH20 TaxID=3156616 RepID=UPI0032B4F17B